MSKNSAASPTAEPGGQPAERAPDMEAPARAERREALLRFLANPPRDVAEAGRALREADEHYGDEVDRELADLKAERHPLQRIKADSSMG